MAEDTPRGAACCVTSWSFDGRAPVSVMTCNVKADDALIAARTAELERYARARRLTVSGPPLLAVAALIKIDSRGPALYKQTRIGRNGKPFTMWKFRSMHINADQLHAKLSGNSTDPHLLRFKAKQDPRITRMGRLIRKSSIDELPQLWNVLAGDMSIVGPRPALPKEVARYRQHHFVRFEALPGITGPWQVSGRNAILDFEEVVRLEASYLRGWTVWRDFVILLRTVPVVLSMKGAF